MTETAPETPREAGTVVLDDQQLVRLGSSVASQLATYLGVPTIGPVAPGQPVEVSVEVSVDGPHPALAPSPDAPEPATSQIPAESVQEASV